jgi:hypothetical protein
MAAAKAAGVTSAAAEATVTTLTEGSLCQRAGSMRIRSEVGRNDAAGLDLGRVVTAGRDLGWVRAGPERHCRGRDQVGTALLVHWAEQTVC